MLLEQGNDERKFDDNHSIVSASTTYVQNDTDDNDANKSIGYFKGSDASSDSSFDEKSKSSTLVSIINLSQQFIGAGLLR